MEQTIRPGSMRSTLRPLVTNRSRNLGGNFATSDSFPLPSSSFSIPSPSRYRFTDSRSMLCFLLLLLLLVNKRKAHVC